MLLEVKVFSSFFLSFLLLLINRNLNISLFRFAFNSVWDRLAQDLNLRQIQEVLEVEYITKLINRLMQVAGI